MRHKLNNDKVAEYKALAKFLDNPSEITESELNELLKLEYKEYIVPRRRCNLSQFLCIMGLIQHLKILGKIALTDLQIMIRTDHYSAFVKAIQNGYLNVLQYLEELIPDELQLILESIEAFRLAAEHGHLEILKYIAIKCSKTLQSMVKENHYNAFRKAAQNGHLKVLEHLAKFAPDDLQAMISAQNYDAYSSAAINGHLEILKYLEQNILKDDRQAMFNAVGKRTFEVVAKNAHLPVLEHFRKNNCYLLPPDDLNISEIASNGHLDVLKYFAKLDKDKFVAILTKECKYAFSQAATKGHLEVLKYLVKKVPDHFQTMIEYDNYGAFRWAALHSRIKVLEYLEESVKPDVFQAMILAENYFAFRQAAGNGHVEVLEYLAKKAPAHLQAMIIGEKHNTFSTSFNYLAVMQYLAKMVDVKSVQDVGKIIDECICAKDVESVGILLLKAPKNLVLNMSSYNISFKVTYVLKEAFIKYGIPEGMTVNDKALNELILTIRNTSPILSILCQAANETASVLNIFSMDIIGYILSKIIRLYSFDINETYIRSNLPAVTHGFFKENKLEVIPSEARNLKSVPESPAFLG